MRRHDLIDSDCYCYTFLLLLFLQFFESLEIPILFITSTLVCALWWLVRMFLCRLMCVFLSIFLFLSRLSLGLSFSHSIVHLYRVWICAIPTKMNSTIETWNEKGNRRGCWVSRAIINRNGTQHGIESNESAQETNIGTASEREKKHFEWKRYRNAFEFTKRERRSPYKRQASAQKQNKNKNTTNNKTKQYSMKQK